MKKVMIVDDEVLVRIGIKSMTSWEQYGYTIVADASDGEEALKKIRQYEPHIILTDLKMQPMDGFDLIAKCAADYPRIRFIVLSNYNDFENVRKAMKLGAYDYIFKLTIHVDELLKIMDEASMDLDEEEMKPRSDTSEVVYKNLDAIKNNLVRQALTKKDGFLGGVQKGFDDIHLKIDFRRPYCAGTIQPDSLEIVRKRGDFLENDLFLFSMENIITEILGRGGRAEVFLDPDQDFLVVINQGEAQGWKEFFEILELKFGTLVKYIKQYYGIGISGAVSGELCGIEKLKAAAERNKKLLGERFFRQTGELAAGPVREYEDMVLPEEYRTAPLEQLLLNGDFHGMEDYMEKLLLFFEDKGCWRPEDIRRRLMKAYKKLNLGLSRYGIDVESIRDENGANLEDAIGGYACYGDIECAARELLTLYRKEYESMTGKPCRREIALVKSYVCDHLSEELSIVRIGEVAGMSESRFSHVFKEETGISFMEYVGMVRMEKARELLQNTDLRINEIAERIGISNPNYFSAQYKKRTGQSPNEFRRSLMEQNMKEK